MHESRGYIKQVLVQKNNNIEIIEFNNFQINWMTLMVYHTALEHILIITEPWIMTYMFMIRISWKLYWK